MSFEATTTLKSKMQVDIAGTYTDIPGAQNFTPDPGENGTFEAGDLTSEYELLRPTGVGSGGTVGGSKLLDVLDPVDQFLQKCFNNGGVPATPTTNFTGVAGKAFISETDVDWPFDGILTKWTPKAEKKNGWMVDFEFKLADRLVMNEVDPV